MVKWMYNGTLPDAPAYMQLRRPSIALVIWRERMSLSGRSKSIISFN